MCAAPPRAPKGRTATEPGKCLGRTRLCSSATPDVDDSASSAEDYQDGVVAATRKRRANLWCTLKSHIVENDPLATWRKILQQQLDYAKTHGRHGQPQRASSTKTLLERTAGTLMKYAPQLGKPPQFWNAECSRLHRLAFREGANRDEPATWPIVREMILTLEGAGHRRAALWLYLTWITCSRGTSTSNLLVRNIFVESQDVICVTYVEGKTLATTGPYSLHLHIPSAVMSEFEALKAARLKRARLPGFCKLFPQGTEKLVASQLKSRGLTIRSLRRGSLQTLAMSGMPPKQLLMFSRHKDVAGLGAYLEHGRFAKWEAITQLQWGTFLTQE